MVDTTHCENKRYHYSAANRRAPSQPWHLPNSLVDNSFGTFEVVPMGSAAGFLLELKTSQSPPSAQAQTDL